MNRKKYLWIENSSRDRLAKNLAEDITVQINQSIKANGRASVAFSGGSTPTPMFAALSECEIDWSKVIITLVDERCVAEQHILSNARFIKNKLLDKLPEPATFIPLYYSELDDISEIFYKVISTYCVATDSELDDLAPFDVVVLGMGGDGHTASFFPDADNINTLVDTNTDEYLFSSESVSTQVSRITWSLRMLLNTKMLALHFTGDVKKKVFEQAANGGDAAELPIRTAIFQNNSRLKVYYAD